jgi:uncharacterized cupin superfamily protein
VTLEPVSEAKLEPGPGGLVPAGDGWFVVNVADAQAMHTDRYGGAALFEARPGSFPEFGINVRVLQPGQPNSLYHREDAQEAVLVLSGECLAIVEDEERPLRKGDFVHLPPGTAHVIVGAGDGPSMVLMVGTRKRPEELLYPVSEPAARHGASVAEETADESQAYEGVEPWFGTLGLTW